MWSFIYFASTARVHFIHKNTFVFTLFMADRFVEYRPLIIVTRKQKTWITLLICCCFTSQRADGCKTWDYCHDHRWHKSVNLQSLTPTTRLWNNDIRKPRTFTQICLRWKSSNKVSLNGSCSCELISKHTVVHDNSEVLSLCRSRF